MSVMNSVTCCDQSVHVLDKFTHAYVKCALWSSTDEHGNALGERYTLCDIDPESLSRMEYDCLRFQEENAKWIGDRRACAGYDFWLTRNRHGAGFWSHEKGFYPGDERSHRLTERARAYGECVLHVGDDGLVHCG